MARCYEQLARYLELKSRMFDPDIEDESRAPLYDLALANGQLMATLNQTKLSLLTRLRGDRGQRGTRRTLHYYFVAQDIHERASSSHIQYQTLREHFRHSDVLFRFQRLMSMQGGRASNCHAVFCCVSLINMIRILSALLRILMLRWSGCAITAHPPIYSKHWDFC